MFKTPVLCSIATLVAGALSGQDDHPTWRWDLFVEETLAYDSNAFKLSDDAIRRFDDDVPGDRVSRRFDDMDSEDDLVLSTLITLVGKSDGLGGRPLRVIPSAQYDYFTQNQRKSHPGFELGTEQELGSGPRSASTSATTSTFSQGTTSPTPLIRRAR